MSDPIGCKVVIATHPRYDKALDNVLRSINYTSHVKDIIICVADVPAGDAEATARAVQDRTFVHRVYTCPMNLFEYTSFVTLGHAMREGRCAAAEDDMFFIMHDTCEGGYRFWSQVRECAARARQAVTQAQGVDWFPVCDHYNIGFATADFVRRMCSVYERSTMNKYQAIQAEVFDTYPLNLRRHARAWAYADPAKPHMYTNYVNDTDAYRTGNQRCVGYLHAVDLKKFFTFDPHWQRNGARNVHDAP